MAFMVTDAGRLACSVSVPDGAPRPIHFAAAELCRYIRAVTGAELPTGETPERVVRFVPPPAQAVGLPICEDDAFVVSVCDDEIVLTGNSDRALLYAAYHLLGQCGVEFWDFGKRGEIVPRRETVTLPEGVYRSSPAFPVRSIAVDVGTIAYALEQGWKDWTERFYFRDFWADRWAEAIPPECGEVTNREFLTLVDWMGKHRLNSLFPAHYAAWGRLAGPVAEAMADRGIMLEMPGHGLPALLPRELFDTDPDLFCMKDDQRHRGGNFCTNNPQALAIVRENALRMVAAHPNLRIVHCWADDVGGGSWCSCPDCAHMPPYEQSMRAANAIADAVREPYPHLLVDFLAYHDTSVPAGNARPAPNLSLMYAPRQRCYAHAIGDPECPRNAEYGRDFEAAIAPFGTRAGTFEYHCDNILWRNVAVPLTQTIAGDQRFYHAGGITMTQTLGFLQSSFWLYPLNYLAFAETAWDLDADLTRAARGYCRARFGDEAVADLLVRWEEALRERIDLSPHSYAEYPFADWAVPPLPDRSALWGADGLDLQINFQDSERSRWWNVLPERLEAQGALYHSARAAEELGVLREQFRALGPAADDEVRALELSILRLRQLEKTMWARLASIAGEKQAEAQRNEASQAALEQAAHFVLDVIPPELRGGWMDWWARDVLAMPWP